MIRIQTKSNGWSEADLTSGMFRSFLIEHSLRLWMGFYRIGLKCTSLFLFISNNSKKSNYKWAWDILFSRFFFEEKICSREIKKEELFKFFRITKYEWSGTVYCSELFKWTRLKICVLTVQAITTHTATYVTLDIMWTYSCFFVSCMRHRKEYGRVLA